MNKKQWKATKGNGNELASDLQVMESVLSRRLRPKDARKGLWNESSKCFARVRPVLHGDICA